MDITYNMIINIIKIIAIIIIVIGIIKRSIKVVAGVVIGLLIFRVFFLHDGTGIMNEFNLKSDNKAIAIFDDFSNKRNEYAIIDANEVYDELTNTVDNSKEYIIRNGQKILSDSTEEISLNLSNAIKKEKIKNLDYETLNKAIRKNYPHLSEEQQNNITLQTMEHLL